MLISNSKITMYESLRKSIKESDEIIMNVSFIRDSGIKLLIKDLREAKEQGKKIKVLTSDYMKVTEPNALYRLMEIGEVRVFNNPSNKSFHSKGYIFKKDDNFEIYIGSSNISYSALITGVEWNYRFNSKENSEVKEILEEFSELYEKNSFELTLEWLREYEKKYKKDEMLECFDSQDEFLNEIIEPRNFQIPALYELSKTREEGYDKAMVVVATGLGKTYLAVFDTMNFNKILFIAHRDEILRGAEKSFRKVYGNSKKYGYFTGMEKNKNSDIVFASISTLSKDEYLNKNYFLPDEFDYIIVDEFHHSSSKSYLKVLEYFKPKFLLGLTATPDRSDNGDIYKLCDYNIAYKCDFVVGINNGWLVPFEYFGIYDDLDYTPIPWRSGKYDIDSLENALIVEKRLNLIYEKYIELKGNFTIGFCASVNHCKTMNRFFQSKGVISEIIIGSTPIKERQNIIEKFKKGKIDIIFTVDIFNEGVDIPTIDTLLFLRPTISYTIFIQQLGRGLRKYKDKKSVKVLDFVGNYRGAELKPLFLTGKCNRKKEFINITDKTFVLPSGCSAKFDFKLIEYFESLRKKNLRQEELLKQEYLNLMEKLEKVPSIMEIYTYGELPVHMYLKTFKSWYLFQKRLNLLNEKQEKYSEKAINFMMFLENTAMTKSYKMVVLLSIFEKLQQEKSLDDLAKYFEYFYSNKVYKKDLSNKKHTELNREKFKKLIEEYPLKYLTEKNKNSEFFSYGNKKFSLDFSLYEELKNNNYLLEEVKERINYRIINYFNRKYMEN